MRLQLSITIIMIQNNQLGDVTGSSRLVDLFYSYSILFGHNDELT